MPIPEKVKGRLPNNTIFLGYRGSQAHGTYVPKDDPNSIDDIDLMGVFIGSIEHYFGFGSNEVVESFPDEYDLVCYELRKFVYLLMKNNPNVLSMLWLEPESTLYSDTVWQFLVQNRHLFVSKLAYHSFTGYAHAQLQKMTAFGEKQQFQFQQVTINLSDLDIPLIDGIPKLPPGATNQQKEAVRQYEEVRRKYFSGYMGEKRKNNVIKYGYDTKNAAHLIRLMEMCCEFLKTGEFKVRRSNAKALVAIKQGKYPLINVQYWANYLFGEAKELFQNCTFPERPDKDKVEALLIRILTNHFCWSVCE
jgi:uncharacterized protein